MRQVLKLQESALFNRDMQAGFLFSHLEILEAIFEFN